MNRQRKILRKIKREKKILRSMRKVMEEMTAGLNERVKEARKVLFLYLLYLKRQTGTER